MVIDNLTPLNIGRVRPGHGQIQATWQNSLERVLVGIFTDVRSVIESKGSRETSPQLPISEILTLTTLACANVTRGSGGSLPTQLLR